MSYEFEEIYALVLCETSGQVRDALAKQGAIAYSCDVLEDRSGDGKMHLQCDAFEALDIRVWDIVIAHPPCTFLTTSAAWAFHDKPMFKGKPRNIKPGTLIGKKRRDAREKAVQFVKDIYNHPNAKRVCIENPKGFLSTMWMKYTQLIQPYNFGHDASKGTCLWLRKLKLLENGEYIEPRIVNGLPRWANQTDSGQNRLPPTEDRWQVRSDTYSGVAAVMAKTWIGQIREEQRSII